MIIHNNEKIRQELARRYLNAETTLEEERLLADYLSDPDIILSAEEEDIILMLQSSSLIGIADISDKKADEFDRLMQSSRSNKRGKYMAIQWIVSAAAAVTLAVLFLPSLHINRTKEKSEIAMTTPVEIDVKSAQATKVVNSNLTAEDKVPTTDNVTLRAHKVIQETKKAPTFLAEKKVPRHESGENNMEKQNQIKPPEAQDISTSELLETIHIFSVMKTNDIIITASSKNDGFIIKTTNSNELSRTYMLKRSPDGTSIEIKSQPTANRVQSCSHELPRCEGGRQSQYINI